MSAETVRFSKLGCDSVLQPVANQSHCLRYRPNSVAYVVGLNHCPLQKICGRVHFERKVVDDSTGWKETEIEKRYRNESVTRRPVLQLFIVSLEVKEIRTLRKSERITYLDAIGREKLDYSIYYGRQCFVA